MPTSPTPPNAPVLDDCCVLLMAGGSGLRLWPLSRATRTKPFMSRLGAHESLLAETAARLSFISPERIFVNVTRGLEQLVQQHLPRVPVSNIIVAPDDRDTLPTLLFASSHIAQRYPEATLLLLASDNTVGDDALFKDTVARAVQAASEGPHLVSIGIKPTEPSTQFGYMALGEPYAGLPGTWYGTGYCEKPHQSLAQELYEGGMHDWNSGMFAWTLASFARALEHYAPAESAVYQALCAAPKPAEREGLFRSLATKAVDTGLLEHVPAENGVVRHVFVRGTFAWDDLGTFDSLTRALPADANGNQTHGDVQAVGCTRCVLVAEAPSTLHVRGLSDSYVIRADTGDTLVVARKRLGDVRAVRSATARSTLRLDATGTWRADACTTHTLDSDGLDSNSGTAVELAVLGVDGLNVRIDGTHARISQDETRSSGTSAPDAPTLLIASDAHEFGRAGADLVRDILSAALARTEGDVFVTMSAGETPKGLYASLVAHHRSSLLWSRVHFVQMDEWQGMAPSDSRSFAHELRTSLVEPLGMRASYMDGTGNADSSQQLEAMIVAAGGFVLAVHGIGVNAHLGFNEPGAAPSSAARVTELSPTTSSAATARFTPDPPPTRGLTLGLGLLARAANTLLIARGHQKAPALAAMLRPACNSAPASHLLHNASLTMLLDRGAFDALLREQSAP